MDFDQTQAIDDYEEEEEEQVEKDKAYPKKKEAAQLKVFSQQGFKESIFPVFQGDNVIGRDGKCKITIPIKALSKKHACIEVQRDLHLIYDCESKNRTKKGKSFLKPTIRYELKHGDMLTLGDVKCQYLIDLDTEEDEGGETGSETGSESMLPDATTEEELDADKPVVHKDVPNKSAPKSGIPSDDLLRVAEDIKVKKPHKDEEEAYAADTDSDTDEDRPLAVAAMATVLYSSEDEHETPARQRAAVVPSKRNTSMEGQTLAFGLGSPDDVFQKRDSSSSATSHPGQTASVPPTLMLSSESDIQSDGKADLSSDNKRSSSKHPGARVTETQPTCEPTLVYGSESEDGSPMKRPRHPEARVIDLQNPPCDPTLLYGSESEDASPIKKPRHSEARLLDTCKQDPPCDPTLLYGSESEDASPIKKPRHPRASNVPTVLDESDSGEGMKIKAPEDSELRKDSYQVSNEQTLRYSEIPGSSPGEIAEAGTDDKQEEDAAQDAETTLPYATAEMSSTDDEEESDVEKPTSCKEPTKPNRIEESGKQESNDEEDNMATDEYGEDCATQPYTADSNFETDSETIPFVGGNAADKSDAKQPAKPSDVEATQAYCIEEEEEEGDSDSSDSQPLPIGPTAVAAHDDMAATLAYGLEATQAYIVTEKDDDTDDEKDKDDRGPHRNDDPTLAYDLQATQAYGVGAVEDTDDEDNNERESDIETVEGQSSKSGAMVNRIDAVQATIPYGLEATQAYGADETDDEDSNDQDKGSRGGDNDERENHVETVEGQSSKTGTMVNRIDTIQATVPYGLEATQAYGAEETDEEDSNDQGSGSGGGDQARGDEPTLAYGLAATLPYGRGDDDDDDNDEDSNKKVEEDIARHENQATVAYGLEETQAYDDDNNDADSAQNSAIEATQAYGIEEPSEAAQQAQPNKQTAKNTTTNKRVAFASSSAESTEVAEIDETEVDASVIETDKKSKPSTSTAVVTGEELQDSEDLIQPRSARSRRGRKKPVIQESQEEESQQASERKSPTEGKSKATNKLRKGRSQAASVTSSTADRTEELEGACGTLEDEKPVSTPASRKGRRGAMRVTIEPEEPDEEEAPQETSTRRRGRKSKQADDQEGNKKETSTPAGRKRGRQTAKTTSVVEGSGEVSVEVEETPAPKSRRGRRGKLEQTEAVSVSETPLKTVKKGKSTGNQAIDTAATTTDVADSETTTAVDVEPTVRRGGRGRGKKGTTPKKMVQEVEAQVDQEESIESQPVTLVEATPSRGKGKSRGRGKRTQSSTNEPGTTESLDPEVSAISNEAKVAVASPARGKVRGKGRGKKAQPLSTESEVPETSVVSEEELQPPETPTVTVASKGRGRGRQGRGKKTQVPSNTELESSEDISQTLSAPESSAEGSQIRRGRGRGKVPVSRESSEPGPSSNMVQNTDVEGTPAKKSRRGKDPSVSRSPSLRQGKPAGESNPRVIFTGLVDKQGEKVVTSLGGELVDNIHSCTHLVTDKVRRTVKFLCGLTNGQLIVLPSWLDACKRAKSFVDSTPFLVKDKDAEKQFKFDLQRSHEVALRHGLLEGYKVHVTKKVKPEPSQMKDIIQSAKGMFLSSMPRGKEDKVFVISCEEDRSICKKPLEAGIPVVSAEVLLTGILRQQLDLEEHKLFADEMSDTSQDTTSSSGQNKRRRQPSEAGTLSSPKETKTSGSKRRKR